MSATRRPAKPPVSEESRRVDYLIITALEHERDAVLSKLRARRLPKRGSDVYTYYEAWFANERPEGLDYRIIVTSATVMGPLAAGALTSAALRRWQPDHLLLVGIAGGMPEEASVGDVVVPQFVASDILGRYGGDDRRTVRWVSYEVDESMLDSAMNFRDGWQDLIEAEPPEPVTSRRRAAVVLSGGNVVASPAIAAQYGEAWDGKAGAIEMEAAGVAAATRGFKKRPAFFMIRGVSDPVNSLSNDEIKERWRAYAADVAAAYAIGLIRSGPSVPIAVRSATSRRRRARRAPPSSEDTGDRDGRPRFRNAPQTADELEAALSNRFGITGREAESLIRLWAAFRGGRATVVLGAEVASWSGVPTEADLIRRFQSATGARAKSLAPLMARYAAQHSRQQLRTRLVEWLDDWNKPLTPIHQVLPMTNVRWIVSLTADRLAEEACRTLRRQFCAITFSEDLAYSRPDLLPIVKWNGTLDHPHTLTMDPAADSVRRGKRTAALVRRAMIDTEVVFVGCRPADADVQAIVKALRRGSDARPIAITSHSSHGTAWRRLGAAPVVSRTDDGLQSVADIVGLVAGVAPDQLPHDFRAVNRRKNPFRRLEPYRTADAADFVGREQETREVVRSLESLRALVLFGSSGIGKSSFLQAALIPAYEREHSGAGVVYEVVAPDLPERWASLASTHGDALLVLDQFERYFDTAIDERRRRFLHETLPETLASRPGLRVLFSIRRDRIADLHPFRGVHSGLFADSRELMPMSSANAARVLTTNFRNAGYDLAPSAAKVVVAGTLTGGDPYLPSLQLHGHALFEKVESLRIDGSLAGGDRIGAEHITAVLQRDVVKRFVRDALLVFAGGEHQALLLQVLRRLTLNSRRQEVPRRRLNDDFLDADAALAVLDMLVDQRLVRYVAERDAYELVHDTLVEAIEDGPLAIETDYSNADLLAFLVDAERRDRMPAAQAMSVLRFSLRRKLAIVPWLTRLEQLGVSGTTALVELARDSDPDVAASAMHALREQRPLLPLATQEGIRRYLLATVMATFWEEEPLEKGDAALRLLLALGLTEAELPALMDFIDPYRHGGDPNTTEIHQWTDTDRTLVMLALPDILGRAPASELARFGRHSFLQVENELGPEIYREILLGLARRGERKELRDRYETVLSEVSEAGNPEVIAYSLAWAPPAVADDPSFDDMRRRMIDQYLFDPRQELVGWLVRILTQLAPRDPAVVMRAWLDGFSRWAHDEDAWPAWRALASILLAHPEARKLYLDYYAASSSVSESMPLADVLLWLPPLPDFRASELPPPVRVRQVARSLDRSMLADGDLETLGDAAARGELSALDLWRAGVLLAGEPRPVHDRWVSLLQLADIVLRRAAAVIPMPGRKALVKALDWREPLTQQQLMAAVLEADRNDTTLADAKAAFVDAVKALAAGGGAASAVPIARALLVTSPRLDCENPYWPPLGCPPEQWPVLELLRSMPEGLPKNAIGARLLVTFDAWYAALPRDDAERLVSVATWMLQKAAEIVAPTGAAEYERWFRELMEVRDDWTLGCPAHGSSCYRWLFQRRDCNEAPWWALHNDPRAGSGTDETEMGWLIEAALSADPRDGSPIVRRWLAEVLHHSAGDVSGFANQPRIGTLLEQLTGTAWVHELAATFSAEKLEALFDDAAPSQVRAGLRIWGGEQPRIAARAGRADDGQRRVSPAALRREGAGSLVRTARIGYRGITVRMKLLFTKYVSSSASMRTNDSVGSFSTSEMRAYSRGRSPMGIMPSMREPSASSRMVSFSIIVESRSTMSGSFS